MKLRSGGKATTVAMAAAVAAAEGASMLWYMFTPWFLSPGSRSLYAGIVFNIGLVIIISKIMERYWTVSGIKDAVLLGVWLTVMYTCIQGPFLITWYNPVSYSYLIGPIGHTAAMMIAIIFVFFYFTK